MQNLRKSFKPAQVTLFIFMSLTVSFFFYFSQGPDQTLHLSREIHSDLSPERLERNISSPMRWPQWFYSLSQVTVLSTPALAPAKGAKSGANQPETTPFRAGSILLLKIDPNKGFLKKFELTAKVVDYVPLHRLHLKIINDSSGRLTRLFDELDWEIEIQPQLQGSTIKGSTIKGTATAHTRHWRARLFGNLAEKILMNQVFYPNLIELSELKQPFYLDPAPHLPSSI